MRGAIRQRIRHWRYRRAWKQCWRSTRERKRLEHLYGDVDELPLHIWLKEFARLLYMQKVRKWWP